MEGKSFQVYLTGDLRGQFEEELERRGKRGKPMPANRLLRIALEQLLEADADEVVEETTRVRRPRRKPKGMTPMTAEEKAAAKARYDAQVAAGKRHRD